MRRRGFLGSTLAGVAMLAGCRGSDDASNASVDYALTEGQALRSFNVLRNESPLPGKFIATLFAAPGPQMVSPGTTTSMLLYNKSHPGPLIELVEGQHVAITLQNGLANDTTIHWHGLPIPANQDGNPMDPVPAGATRVYEYDLPVGSAGTYWYHPHPHLNTAEQVARGLAAPLIIRAGADPLSHIPEVTLFVTGVRLDANAEISPDNAIDWTIGRQNELLLVNGSRLPVHSVRPGATQRWRVVNASASHHFRLALEGHTLTLVGTDGGLLGAPVAGLAEIIVAPAQRVEIVVTIDAAPNARYRLQALQYQTDLLGLGVYTDTDLMTVATTAETAALPLPVPSTLRPISDLGVATATQQVELSEVSNLCTRSGATVTFLINGKIFDPDRVDLTSTVGRVELWDIVNNTGMAHPFHIHGTQFQLVSTRVGTVETPAPYLAWIDTILIPPKHAATIKVQQMFPGKRMFHCHILEHEDNCMMAILDVQAAHA